jgi:predicted nucleic acid-binding protein
MKLYVDSNVFISLIREEVSTNRTLFDEALSFFEKVQERKDTIVISTLNLIEIKTKSYNTKEDLIEDLSKRKINFKFIENNQNIESKRFEGLGIHKPDSIHVALAIKEKCDCIMG